MSQFVSDIAVFVLKIATSNSNQSTIFHKTRIKQTRCPVFASFYHFFHCPGKNTSCHGKNPTCGNQLVQQCSLKPPAPIQMQFQMLNQYVGPGNHYFEVTLASSGEYELCAALQPYVKLLWPLVHKLSPNNSSTLQCSGVVRDIRLTALTSPLKLGTHYPCSRAREHRCPKWCLCSWPCVFTGRVGYQCIQYGPWREHVCHFLTPVFNFIGPWSRIVCTQL